MLNFVFILTIILEIFITYFLIQKLISAQKRVLIQNEEVIFFGKIILEINNKLKTSIEKINKVVSIFTNKKLLLLIKIIKTTILVIQTIILIRTFSFSKGIKGNFKNLKKILLTEFSGEIIKNICKFL